MLGKISGYAEDGTSMPIQSSDYLDLSNNVSPGVYDESKKILVSEFLTFLNDDNINNIYTSDGQILSSRTLTADGFETRWVGGNVVVEMADFVSDYGFIVKDNNSVDRTLIFYDQVAQSGKIEISSASDGIWFTANDNEVGIGTSTPTERLEVAGNQRLNGIFVQNAAVSGNNNIFDYNTHFRNYITLGGEFIGSSIPATGNGTLVLNSEGGNKPYVTWSDEPTRSLKGFLGRAESAGDALATTAAGDFFWRLDGSANLLFGTGSVERMRVTSAGNVAIGKTTATGKIHIDQSSLTAAIPVVKLEQADLSEEFIDFIAVEGVGNPIEDVGAKTLTTTKFIRISVNGTNYYLQAGTIA